MHMCVLGMPFEGIEVEIKFIFHFQNYVSTLILQRKVTSVISGNCKNVLSDI